MLSNQNARKDVIIQSSMCIFYTLILQRTPLPFKMINIVFCFVDPKQYPQTQKMNFVSVRKGPKKKLILRTGLFVEQHRGQPPHLRAQLFSHGKRYRFLSGAQVQMSQEIKLFPHLSECRLRPCFSLRPWIGYTHLFLQALIYCLYLSVLVWFRSQSLYMCRFYSIPAFPYRQLTFFCSKILSERYFKLLRLALILLLITSPNLITCAGRIQSQITCKAFRCMHFLGGMCVVNPITSDFLCIHVWSGNHLSISSGQKMLEINLATLPT